MPVASNTIRTESGPGPICFSWGFDMSAELINLNRARKAKAKRDQTTEAEANRVKFGRTKAEKLKAKAEAEKAARHIDGHKIDGAP